MSHWIERRGWEKLRSARTAHACLIISLLMLACLLLKTGSPILTYCPWDVPMYLDGAWRIVNGQVPHVDFSLPVGAFSFYLTALGMWLGGPCASSIVYGNIVFMVATAVVGFALMRNRASPWLAAAVVLFWSLLAVAPRPVGNWYRDLTFAVLYNRQGDVLVGMLYAVLFLPRRTPVLRTTVLVDSFLGGVLLAVTLFTKINFACLAIAAVVLRHCLSREKPVRTSVVLTVAGVSVLLVLLVSQMTPIAITTDYFANAAAQSDSGRIRQFLLGLLNQWWLLPLVLYVSNTVIGTRRFSSEWCVVIFITGSFLGLLATNRQFDESPLLLVLLLYLLAKANPDWTARKAVAVALLAVACFRTPSTDAVACIYSMAKRQTVPTPPALVNTPIEDFEVDSKFQEAYRQRIQSGMTILTQQLDANPGLRSEMRLAVMECTDPYTFACGLLPRQGGNVWLIDGAEGIRDPSTLGNATHVLIPSETCCALARQGRTVALPPYTQISSNCTYCLFRLNPR